MKIWTESRLQAHAGPTVDPKPDPPGAEDRARSCAKGATGGADPRFATGKDAKFARYGPHTCAQVEHGWYRHPDSDGFVCERAGGRTAAVVCQHRSPSHGAGTARVDLSLTADDRASCRRTPSR